MTPVFGHGRLRLYLLKLLDESPRHGYDVIRELEDRFMGLYSPSAGTVYPRLARLTTEGLVAQTESGGRKLYTITDAGRAELADRRDDLDDLESDIAGTVRDLADEIRTEVRGSVRDLRAELKAAAKDMRRAKRHAGRAARAERDPGGPDGAGQDDVAAWLHGQVEALAVALGRWAPDERQRAELRVVLARAADDVVRVLREPRTPQDG